jgi:hypothetical protein
LLPFRPPLIGTFECDGQKVDAALIALEYGGIMAEMKMPKLGNWLEFWNEEKIEEMEPIF